MQQVESNIVRCPDAECAERMIEQIEQIGRQGDSIGGVVECVARNVPKGLGSPVFDKLEADIAKGVMSLPATKGFEIGSGFAGTLMTGSEHNDEFYLAENGEIRAVTNRSGGVQGGISNGENIFCGWRLSQRLRFAKSSVQSTGVVRKHYLQQGRHDPCVLPRAVPMVEAMVALVLWIIYCGIKDSVECWVAYPIAA